jgi:FkbM family methyltransferase
MAIDPNPAYASLYRAKGLELLQYACAEADAEDVDFTVVDSHGEAYNGGEVSYESFSSLGVRGDFATLKPGLDARTIKVKVRRLDSILSRHAPSAERIDLLTVDVEGWELEVLRGLDFSRFQPKVVIIENLFLTPAYRSFMRERGYVLWRYLAPNEVWVRPELLRPGEAASSAVSCAFATARMRAAMRFRH